MGKLDSYTPLGYSLCGVVEEVGAGRRRREGRRPRGLRRQRARAARRAELGAEEPLRPGAGRPRAAARRLRHRRVRSRMQGVRQGRAAARRGGAGHRPRADRAARGAAPGRLRASASSASTPTRRAASWPSGWAPRPAATPSPRPSRPPSRELTGGHGVDQVYLAAGGGSNQPVELAARLAPGPRPGRRHRQVPAGPAVERVLREGARRPVLPQLRPRALRPGVRAGGRGLPDRLRALDRAPQPGVLPRPGRPRPASTWSRSSPTSPTSTTPSRRTGA